MSKGAGARFNEKGTICLRLLLCLFVLMGARMICAHEAEAAFNIVEHGVRAMGRGGAFVAVADDGAAHFYNPAGLVDIPGGLLQSEVVATYRRSRYKSQTGLEDQMRVSNLNPNLFFVADTASDQWKWGVAAFVPYGSSTQWNDRGPLRYKATYSQLGMFVINPNLAVKINPNFSVGMGVDIYQSQVESRKKVDYGALIGQSGKFDGDYVLKAPTTTSVGYNLGLLYKFNDKTRVGASYRSRFEVDFEGVGVISDVPGFVSASSRLTSPGKAKYFLPDDIMFGIAHRLTERLDLAFDVQWTNWSQFENVELTFEDRPSWNTFTPKNWHDKLIYKLGAEYGLSDHATLRAGYALSTSPIPDETFEPAIPDAMRNTFYFGWGYIKDHLAVNTACSFTFFNDRTVENSLGANGTYKSFIPQVSASVSWMF